MNDKVYIIHDDCVWDDEFYPKIVGATTDKNIALRMLQNYIKEVKDIIDFNSMDLVQDDIELDYNDFPEHWIYSESDTHFYLYLNGEYNSNHISINIECLPLCKDLESVYDNETCINDGRNVI